jgi:hypothetical protein
MDIDRLTRLRRATGQRVQEIAERVQASFAKPVTQRIALAHHLSMTPEQRQVLAAQHTPEELADFATAMDALKARLEQQQAKKEKR